MLNPVRNSNSLRIASLHRLMIKRRQGIKQNILRSSLRVGPAIASKFSIWMGCITEYYLMAKNIILCIVRQRDKGSPREEEKNMLFYSIPVWAKTNDREHPYNNSVPTSTFTVSFAYLGSTNSPRRLT